MNLHDIFVLKINYQRGVNSKMTKYDYLRKLKQYLHSLPERERKAAMQYYEKYFDDAGPENERYVIMNLGSPRQLADRILAKNRHTLSGMVHETRKNVKNAQSRLDEKQKKQSYIIFTLLSPVLVLLVILFVLMIAAFAFAVAGALVLMAAIGVGMIVMSIPYIIGLQSVSLVVMGIGLVMIGIPVLLFMPAMNFVLFVIKRAVVGTFALFNKQFNRKAATGR